jgi:hypothetical protein
MTFIHHNFKPGFVSQTGLPAALDSNFAKYTKKLIVDGLNEKEGSLLELEEIKAFFNKTMDKLGFTVAAPGSSVVAVFRTLNIDEDEEEGVEGEEEVKKNEVKKEEEAGSPGTCVLEFRTVEEATSAVAMDGLTFSGSQLHVARPESYQKAVSEAMQQQIIPGGVSTNVVDSPFKVFMGSIPTSLSDEQVMELLKAFGELRSFNLIKDLQTGEPKVWLLLLIIRDSPFSNF